MKNAILSDRIPITMPQSNPRFSGIILIRNRPSALQVCVQILENRDYYAEGFEIIIVDGREERMLEKVLSRWFDNSVIWLVRQPNRGPVKFRNTGAFHVQGVFLFFPDDDNRSQAVRPSKTSDRFQAHPDSVVMGETMNGLIWTSYSEASGLIGAFLGKQSRSGANQTTFVVSDNPVVTFQLLLLTFLLQIAVTADYLHSAIAGDGGPVTGVWNPGRNSYG